VAALTARDAERALRFVTEAGEFGGGHAFTPAVLVELGKLVEADEIHYGELDRVRMRDRYAVHRPGDEAGSEPVEVTYWDIAADHPVCHAHTRGDLRPLKVSDFLSLPRLRKSRVYALWFRPYGIDHELTVPLPSPLWHTKTFLFDRGRGSSDFTERDRLVLELLQPHLTRLWHAAVTRRRLRAAMDYLESGDEQDARGLVVLGVDGRIDFASPAARRLLSDVGGQTRGSELPPALADWLETGAPTLDLVCAGHRVTVSRSGHALLLEEAQPSLGLTSRETQILSWVARGKTNREIAEHLWIAPSTVRKHLENVYGKLGVSTRTAAAARFLGLLDEKQPAS
jgi:DNA-binding CsgD family transcriptional regulator